MARTVRICLATKQVTRGGTIFRAAWGNTSLSAVNQSAQIQVQENKDYWRIFQFTYNFISTCRNKNDDCSHRHFHCWNIHACHLHSHHHQVRKSICIYQHKPIFLPSCKKIRAGRRMVKEDVNDIYGLYYTAGGERMDESTVEVKDENPYYGT